MNNETQKTHAKKTVITLKEFRKKLKAMGYRCLCKKNSLFSQVTVYFGDEKVNGGNIMTIDHYNQYKDYFSWAVNISIQDEDGWRYIA